MEITEFVPISCIGEAHGDDTGTLFDYYAYKKFQKYKYLIAKWRRRQSLVLGHPLPEIEKSDNHHDDIATEFGNIHMHTTCKDYQEYFKAFHKQRQEQILRWMKIEDNIAEQKYTPLSIKFVEDKLKELERKLQYSSFSEDYQEEIIRYRCDWFKVPRLYDVSVVSHIMRKKRQILLSDVIAPHLSTSQPANLAVIDLNFLFPDEIVYIPDVSMKLSIQLKIVINEFPFGVSEEIFMKRFEEKFGAHPNFLEKYFPTFLHLCKEYVDIFHVPETLPGIDKKQLIFPAYWAGVLDSVDRIFRKIWHIINVIVAMKSGSISVNSIIPEILYFFNIELVPQYWGFGNIDTFVQYLIDSVSKNYDMQLNFHEEDQTYYLSSSMLLDQN